LVIVQSTSFETKLTSPNNGQAMLNGVSSTRKMASLKNRIT
jgi:hypothetical protein